MNKKVIVLILMFAVLISAKTKNKPKVIKKEVKESMKIVIFANGESNLDINDIGTIFPVDKIICANGGTKLALRFDITPDIIVGDLDSLTEDISKKFENKKIEWDMYRTRVTDYEIERYLSIL